MKNLVEIIFISKKRNFLRSLRLPLWSINALLAIFITIAVSTAILFLYNNQEDFDVRAVAQENGILLKKLDSLNAFLKQDQESFNNSIAQDNRERTFWQMVYIHPDIWSMGIGGKTYQPPNKSISNQPNQMLNEIYGAIDVLKGKCYLRNVSLNEIQNQIEKNLYLWSHIPSINPVTSKSICSGFGYRRDPIDRNIRMHWGIDIGAPRGTPIYASADGVVTSAGWNGGYGWTLDVDHGFGFKTRYAHCSTLLVKKDAPVKRGQLIATVGSTGRTVAPHLHYEICVSGEKINPEEFINFSSVIFD